MPKWKPDPEMLARFAKVSEIDWARLAAYIDGEGCITIYISDSPKYNEKAHSPKFTLTLVVANTDPRMVQWIYGRFGGYIHIRKQQKSKWRVAYHWAISAHGAAIILKRVMEYLVTKREQAEVALAVVDTMQKNNRRVPLEVTAKRKELADKLFAMKRQHFPEDYKFVQ